VSGFTAPAVMDGLTAAFRRVTPLDGEVRDGNIPGDLAASEVIAVGFAGPDDDGAAEAQETPAGLGARERETYDVHCAVAVAQGDNEVGPVRSRCFELLNDCRAQLLADPKLGGACMKARIASWVLREDLTVGGPVLTLRFDVHVDAFTT
jgi:hypothetical protein